MTPDRYVQAVRVQGPRGAGKVLRKYGPGVMDFAGPSKDGMTRADADILARHIASETTGVGFAYVRPEGMSR
jgi:hypothetical protein